ncbi:MAG: 30S ribosomal protein S27ae [Candidatus Aenigmarchaeota archaeon]|nr:30S ribosomal protein S27ae [Candidatus Aenigmarchaeota archaeon]
MAREKKEDAPPVEEKKKKERTGKRKRTGRKHSKVSMTAFYAIVGEKLERKKKSCPRCGAGTYLAQHKSRLTCGKCEYTEFDRAKPVAVRK